METFSKLYSYVAAQHRITQDNLFRSFVTISRQTGAGGLTIGERLARYLDGKLPGGCPWTVFDKNLVEEIIKDYELPAQTARYLQEDKAPVIEDMVGDLLKLHPSKLTLIARTNTTILKLAKLGHAILVGRGSPVITKDIVGGVHVRLIGSFAKRKKHIKEYCQFSDKEAEQFIKNEDRGRADYLKSYFHQNIDDPLLYDFIINTDRINFDDAATLIGDMVIKKTMSLRKS